MLSQALVAGTSLEAVHDASSRVGHIVNAGLVEGKHNQLVAVMESTEELTIKKNVKTGEYPIPAEMKIENYERRRLPVNFDRIDLICEFKPGVNNIGAILRGFINAIPGYDAFVKQIEEKMDEIDELKKIDLKVNRHYQNWDGAWNVLNIKPDEYTEFIDMMPKMESFKEVFEVTDDPVERAVAETMMERFKYLSDTYTDLWEASKELQEVKIERDKIRQDLLARTTELYTLQGQERKIAAKIGFDHVEADKRKIHLSDLFANIRVGNILSSLNGVDVENLPYTEVINFFRILRPPHKAEFRRYDFKTDPVTREWVNLEQTRQLGVILEDPRIPRMNFVTAAAGGVFDVVVKCLTDGEDVNASDHAGCSALHLACAHQHREIAQFLVKSGADINSRDKNMMTPLLSAVRKGDPDFVRWIIDKGGDKSATDNMHRNALYYAVKSRNPSMVRQFLNPLWINHAETVWGWTPLHIAANIGHLQIAEMLLEAGANLYTRANNRQLSVDVAAESKSTDVAEYFKKISLEMCGQLVYEVPRTAGAIWIGNMDCLLPKFVGDINATHIIIISGGTGRAVETPGTLSLYARINAQHNKRTGNTDVAKKQKQKIAELARNYSSMPKQGLWLCTSDTLGMEDVASLKFRPKYLNISVSGVDDDDDSDDSWNEIVDNFADIRDFANEYLQLCRDETLNFKGQMIICDSTGVSTSAAILSVILLTCERIRVADSEHLCVSKRPGVAISNSLYRGLDRMEVALNAKKLKRLNARVRNSSGLSIAF